MPCLRAATSRSGTAGPAPISHAAWKTASTRKAANASTNYGVASRRINERGRRRVVVGYIRTVAQAVPDAGSVDDAAGPSLAHDHDRLPRGQDAQCAIARAGAGALPDDVGRTVRMSYWRRRLRRCNRRRL